MNASLNLHSLIGGSLFLSCIDFALFVWNAVFGFWVISVLVGSDAPFKKFLVQIQYNIAHRFHSHRIFPTTTACGLVATTAYLWILYQRNEQQNKDPAILLRLVISVYTTICMLVFRKRSYRFFRLGPDCILKYEQEVAKRDMIHFQPPSKSVANTILGGGPLLQAVLQNDVSGIDNLSQAEPALYVMNHSLYGIEMGLFLNLVYQQKDIFLRGLTDHLHFAFPHGEILRAFGAVDGTRENVTTLMEHKQNILVYPGGGHEMMKPSTVPKYTLIWKERLGFARLAIKHGYPIQPCAAVGTEDMLDIMLDIPLNVLRKGLYFPLPYPVSPQKLQKIYFWFGEPIPTTQYNGDWQNDNFAREVRDKAKLAIENGIKYLQEKQSKDPDRFLIHKFSQQFRCFLKAKSL